MKMPALSLKNPGPKTSAGHFMKHAFTGLVLLFFISLKLHAQEVIPGMIPRFYSIEAATDLPMPSEIAHEQALGGLDLSTLDPDGTTNIWKPTQNTIPEHALLNANAQLEFVQELPSRSGQVRFTVVTPDGRELIINISKKIHNVLLRRNILAKLGYNTQPMNWVSQINLNFKNSIDRDLLKETIKDKFGDTKRWVKNERALAFEMQDILVLTPESDIYNLATGLMPVAVHQGRRLLRAPYIPLALVDASESVNLFPWQAARLVLNNIQLQHTKDLENSFGASWEDARWIGRRLGKLSRSDLEEVVQKAEFPKAVELLLIEKIISRRNDLLKHLNLAGEFLDIPFNPEVSLGNALVNGEITQEFFDGFASRYSYGDPESPFSATEIGYFALSRLQSQAIDAAIGQLNKFLGTNDQENYIDNIKDIIKEQGPFFPVTAVAVPTFHGGFVLSRDIVTGSYLGTNNKVQLVDNFGVTLDAGVFAGVEGGPVPLGIKGGAGLNFQRVYSHVKPILSLKKSMKEPYKNLLVPFVMRKLAKKIDKLTTVTGDDQSIMMGSIIGELKGSLAIGESFIVTDSLVPRVMAEIDLSLSQFYFMEPNMLKVYAKVQSERVMMTRFHLHRASEHVFHIYQDYGKSNRVQFTIKLKSYVPIMAFNVRGSKANAETRFYPINLNPREASVELLKALRHSILSLKHDALDDVVKYHKIKHDVKGAGNTWQFLIFKRNRTGTEQTLGLTHNRGGEEKFIHRRYDAITTGNDYESYATEAINQILSIFLQTDSGLSQSPSSNPGFTLGGKARNKIFTSETDGERMTTVFQRIFNGWKVKPKKLDKFLERLNDEAGEQVFEPISVLHTDSILLYQIQYMYTLTQEGVQSILNATPALLAQVLRDHSQGMRDEDEEQVTADARSFHRDLPRIQAELLKDPTRGMKHFHSWLKSFQETVTIKGLTLLCGKDNIAWQGRIDGFRQGDEAGDSSIFTHVYGELPLPLQITPTQAVMQNWGILEGELLLNWMTERAI